MVTAGGAAVPGRGRGGRSRRSTSAFHGASPKFARGTMIATRTLPSSVGSTSDAKNCAPWMAASGPMKSCSISLLLVWTLAWRSSIRHIVVRHSTDSIELESAMKDSTPRRSTVSPRDEAALSRDSPANLTSKSSSLDGGGLSLGGGGATEPSVEGGPPAVAAVAFRYTGRVAMIRSAALDGRCEEAASARSSAWTRVESSALCCRSTA
jgi:hypothetical protein